METKASPPITHLRGAATLPVIAAYFEFNHLKQLYRQGWLQRGIAAPRCESVAEHTCGVAVLALFLAETCAPELDALKVMRMALLHDFGEIYAGDLTPAHEVSRDEKYHREQRAVVRVLAKLPRGAEYIALWEEYEAGQSPEARFVRQLDRLEMVLQASVYEHQGLADLSEFFAAARPALSSPELQAMLAQLETLRC
jgi:putative hydrolase of HD superfamily